MMHWSVQRAHALALIFVSTVAAATASMALAGCSSTSSPAPVSPPVEDAGDQASVDAAIVSEPSPLIVARPYTLRVPATIDASKPAPLVIGLHGYGPGDDETALEKWLDLNETASERGYLYALPRGTLDKAKLPFWNGTDACCNFYRGAVDDVAYLAAVIDDVARLHSVDARRVFVIGISGGGVMAHRLACDLSDRIAGVISISGTTWKDAARCKPTSPVSVVEFHGDADNVVFYEGGESAVQSEVPYPGARETIEQWQKHAECTGGLSPVGAPVDLLRSVSGAETTIESFGACARGSVELWTAKGGPHAPVFTTRFQPKVFDWFDAHPKPASAKRSN